jgi:transcriptional regulator with XRE-family HTH domain
MTFPEKIIDPEGYAESYGDNYRKYRAVMDAAHSAAQDAARREARKLGVGRQTLERWLKGKTKPKSIEGLEAVKHLLPLHYGHEHFPAVNKLVAWALFSGSIDKSHNFELQNKPERLELASSLLKRLRVEHYPRKGGNFLHSAEGGAAFGRLLRLLGVPQGRKMDARLALPGYATALLDGVETRQLPAEETRMARKHLRDFVGVLLHTRLQRGKTHRYIDLPKNRSREHAAAFGEEGLRLGRVVANPHASLRLYEKTGGHAARILLPRD